MLRVQALQGQIGAHWLTCSAQLLGPAMQSCLDPKAAQLQACDSHTLSLRLEVLVVDFIVSLFYCYFIWS